MKRKSLLLFLFFILIFAYFPQQALANPSEGFFKKGSDWYDNWNINRNSAEGNDGYFPAIVYESIGKNIELAYQYGEWFQNEYSNKVSRAGKIMSFVQSMVKYEYDDESPFVLAVTGNEVQEEWAWNPDEMAHMIDFAYNNHDVTNGDCEDFAFLLTVMYYAAGYNVTIVNAIDHAALLIWLPEYSNANVYWDIGDGEGAGWIWVEATGDQNPLGWTPDDYKRVEFTVRQLEPRINLLTMQERGSALTHCLITMATYESELQGEVQFIKDFRDSRIKSTFIGGQFTLIFNVWYYSFSPIIADYIAKDQVAKEAVKDFLYPLMGIMRVSFWVQNLLAFNPEFSVMIAILVASLLIGVIYFSFPMMMLITLIDRYTGFIAKNKRRLFLLSVISFFPCLIMVGLCELTVVSQLMIVSVAMLAITSISISALAIGIKIEGKIFRAKK